MEHQSIYSVVVVVGVTRFQDESVADQTSNGTVRIASLEMYYGTELNGTEMEIEFHRCKQSAGRKKIYFEKTLPQRD